MTNAEILIQILHEVTGRPKRHVRRWVKLIRPMTGDNGRALDRKLSPAEAEDLLSRLRAEKPGIARWLIEGATEWQIGKATSTHH